MGRSYFILSDGSISRKEDTVLFQNSEVRKVIPIEDIDEIFVLAEVSLTSKVLKLMAKAGVTLHLFNRYGFYTGSFYPRETNVSGFLIIKQSEHYLDHEKRLFLAKSFVLGAIENLSDIYKLGAKDYLKKLADCKSVEDVMSVEGDFRKRCYAELEKITGLEFGTRSKRPPQNPLNALISFGNSLVYAKVLGEIYFTQLNPTISYLHEPSTKRFSLSLDMAEIFKPILSDGLIVRLLRSGKLKEEHFVKESGMCYLSKEGARIFLSEFDQLLNKTIKHRKLKRRVSHRSLIRLELYKLIKHLVGDEVYQPLIYRSLR